MKIRLERRMWRCIWICFIVFHLIATPRMYRMWWWFACRWAYPYMIKAKAEGRQFAQPYGEGIMGVLRYLDSRFV